MDQGKLAIKLKATRRSLLPEPSTAGENPGLKSENTTRARLACGTSDSVRNEAGAPLWSLLAALLPPGAQFQGIYEGLRKRTCEGPADLANSCHDITKHLMMGLTSFMVAVAMARKDTTRGIHDCCITIMYRRSRHSPIRITYSKPLQVERLKALDAINTPDSAPISLTLGHSFPFPSP